MSNEATTPKAKTLPLEVYNALPEAMRVGYAPKEVKVKAIPAIDPNAEWINQAEFATSKDAKAAAAALTVDTGKCAVVEGSTRSERKLAAALGDRGALDGISIGAALVPTKKGHKVVTGKSALIVAAALARLEGNATEQRKARAVLAQFKR